jgi:predicted transcriptional regulator
MTMTIRINARVDEELAGRIAAIRRRTGKNVTEVIEESLAQYCDGQLAEAPVDILGACRHKPFKNLLAL